MLSKVIIFIVVCVLIGVSIFFIADEKGKDKPQPGSKSITANSNSLHNYTNKEYNYQFWFPGNYTLNDEYPNYLLLKKPSSPQYDWTFKVDTYQNETGKNFQDFITNQLMLNCAADGPNASLSCDKVLSQEPFVTTSGLAGYQMYLNQVSVKNGVTTNAKIGPYYVFDISKETDNRAQAINFYPANFVDLPKTDLNDAAVLESIAKSFKFHN